MLRLPRMRGDRPLAFVIFHSPFQFTPHARGSTLTKGTPNPLFMVYPACAGIDLAVWAFSYLVACLPRMRGDRPPCYRCVGTAGPFTPHARGSTSALAV